MARAAKKKDVSKLRLDMFVLIFGIYCCLNSVALIVFGIELIVGRRKAKKKINVNATSVKDDLGYENANPEITQQTSTQDHSNEIETIEIS